jgi:hypothetical protein
MGVSNKAIKGSKALYGQWETVYVKVGFTIPGQYYDEEAQDDERAEGVRVGEGE